MSLRKIGHAVDALGFHEDAENLMLFILGRRPMTVQEIRFLTNRFENASTRPIDDTTPKAFALREKQQQLLGEQPTITALPDLYGAHRNDPFILNVAGVAAGHTEGGYGRSRRYLDEAYSLNPNIPQVTYNCAAMLCRAGKTTEVFEFMRRTLELAEKYPEYGADPKHLREQAMLDRDFAKVWYRIEFKRILAARST